MKKKCGYLAILALLSLTPITFTRAFDLNEDENKATTHPVKSSEKEVITPQADPATPPAGEPKAAVRPFITIWKTNNPGISNATSITIPTTGTGYNYDVDWNNDGTFEELGLTGSVTHTYPVAGTYTVAIRGSFPRIYFNGGGDCRKILSIVQWGDIAWTSMVRAFSGCLNLAGNAADAPNLSGVTNMAQMFANAWAFNQNIGSWNVSAVTNMFQMFYEARAFNQNIGAWNVSAVTNMAEMFFGATTFSQNIGAWNVSAVTSMAYMFLGASAFNQNIRNWNVSAVTNMSYMFYNASIFNQNIGNWNITNAASMTDIFNNSGISQTNYDAILTAWNTAGYTNKNLGNASPLKYCSAQAARTNMTTTKGWTITGDAILCRPFITTWKTDNPGTSSPTSITIPIVDTGYNYDVDWNNDGTFEELGLTGSVTHTYPVAGTYTVAIRGSFPRIYFNFTGDREKILSIVQWGDMAWTSMNSAFMGCSNLAGNATDAPNLSGVTDMSRMFRAASAFNQNISAWNVSAVTGMAEMFYGASAFNQNIGAWNVSAVTNMAQMFRAASAFNQNIGVWNVAAVTDMQTMFRDASAFNQNIGAWNVAAVTNMSQMFQGASAFNQNIGAWNVSAVTNMFGMFQGAGAFNQNIGNWNITNAASMTNIFTNCAISQTNYDAILTAWNTGGYTNKNLGSASPLKYCSAQAARTNMITTKGWTITGDAILCTPFITTWKTDNPGTSNATSITIPTTGGGYNYDVDWNNDGTFEELGLTGSVTHTYPAAGTYTVAIRGSFPRIYFNNGGDRQKILSIVQWGNIAWTSMDNAFMGCINLAGNATDAPILSGVTDMSQMFFGAIAFNQNIGNWNVANVTNMQQMFSGAGAFNQDISAWNVSAVTNMSFMFERASAFNQNIGAWNVSAVTNMFGVFNDAIAFNQNIGAWNVSAVTTMSYMFFGASAFNQNISNWNVANVTNMSQMFRGAGAFNQNIGTWNVAKVTDMFQMFDRAAAFNQNIGAWNVSAVTNMGSMFAAAIAFNQNIGNWNVSAVTNMSFMFNGASAFNQNIGAWNVAAVTNMTLMFNGASAFNQNIGAWNVSAVTNMSFMFRGAGAFNQNIGAWNITNATSMTDIFNNCAISQTNYDGILTAWNTAGYTNKNLGNASPLKYCSANAARTNMITTKGWTITGDAILCTPFITTWKTDNPGTSNATSITIPTTGTGYNYDVDWNNDGTFEQVGVTGSVTHTYPAAGTYTVAIRGSFPRIYFNNGGDRRKILSIVQWGDIAWTNMNSAFFGCSNLAGNANDVPILSGVTDMSRMFRAASAFNQNISAWNVAAVTNMANMFSGVSSFNQNIGTWNVSAVTDMSFMFNGASAFNQDIGAWNVSAVTDMSFMFNGASAFNQNIGAWNITNATSMTDIFNNCAISRTNYDAILTAWNTGGYTNKNLGNTSPLKYCSAQAARTNMITTKGWTITGDALLCISTPTLSGTAFCAGSSVVLNFSSTGTFNAGNQFRAELSDANGSFGNPNPVILGTTTTAGAINGTVPLNTPAGTAYLIRVVSTNPVITGLPTSSQLTIHPFTRTLVSPTNDLTGTLTTRATNNINASNKITAPADVTYQAGQSISLTPGFEARSGTVFKARIQGCDN